MVIRKIVLYPDSPLSQKAEPVKKIGPHLAALAEVMYETMEAHDGVGLAAPQIGKSQRVIVVHEPDKDQPFCLVNPEISEGEGRELKEEGCLSLPEIYAEVARYTRIRVGALNEHGKPLDFVATDLLARIIQHEVDHLDGIMFVDRLDVLTREAKLREWQEMRQRRLSATSNL
jgi:peptide deformylase